MVFVSNNVTRIFALFRLLSHGVDIYDLDLKFFKNLPQSPPNRGLDRGFKYSTTQKRSFK